jgi:hypothetical protein
VGVCGSRAKYFRKVVNHGELHLADGKLPKAFCEASHYSFATTGEE